MSEWQTIYAEIIALLNDSNIRAATSILSIVSFFVSVLAMRRLHEVLTAHRENMFAEQSRFIDQQWQTFNVLLLTNPDVFRLLHEKTSLTDEDKLRRENMYFYLLNLLFSVYTSRRHGVMDSANCEAHFRAVLYHFFGERDEFERLLSFDTFPTEFSAWCRDNLSKSPSDIVSHPANSLEVTQQPQATA